MYVCMYVCIMLVCMHVSCIEIVSCLYVCFQPVEQLLIVKINLKHV